MTRALFALFLLLSVTASSSAHVPPMTYYLNEGAGDDANDCLSASTECKTCNRILSLISASPNNQTGIVIQWNADSAQLSA